MIPILRFAHVIRHQSFGRLLMVSEEPLNRIGSGYRTIKGTRSVSNASISDLLLSVVTPELYPGESQESHHSSDRAVFAERIADSGSHIDHESQTAVPAPRPAEWSGSLPRSQPVFGRNSSLRDESGHTSASPADGLPRKLDPRAPSTPHSRESSLALAPPEPPRPSSSLGMHTDSIKAPAELTAELLSEVISTLLPEVPSTPFAPHENQEALAIQQTAGHQAIDASPPGDSMVARSDSLVPAPHGVSTSAETVTAPAGDMLMKEANSSRPSPLLPLPLTVTEGTPESIGEGGLGLLSGPDAQQIHIQATRHEDHDEKGAEALPGAPLVPDVAAMNAATAAALWTDSDLAEQRMVTQEGRSDADVQQPPRLGETAEPTRHPGSPSGDPATQELVSLLAAAGRPPSGSRRRGKIQELPGVATQEPAASRSAAHPRPKPDAANALDEEPHSSREQGMSARKEHPPESTMPEVQRTESTLKPRERTQAEWFEALKAHIRWENEQKARTASVALSPAAARALRQPERSVPPSDSGTRSSTVPPIPQGAAQVPTQQEAAREASVPDLLGSPAPDLKQASQVPTGGRIRLSADSAGAPASPTEFLPHQAGAARTERTSLLPEPRLLAQEGYHPSYAAAPVPVGSPHSAPLLEYQNLMSVSATRLPGDEASSPPIQARPRTAGTDEPGARPPQQPVRSPDRGSDSREKPPVSAPLSTTSTPQKSRTERLPGHVLNDPLQQHLTSHDNATGPETSTVHRPSEPIRTTIPSAVLEAAAPASGVDLSRVTLLTGPAAQSMLQANTAVGAAVGQTVLLDENLNLETPYGRGILAHELAHVALTQQATGPAEGPPAVVQASSMGSTEVSDSQQSTHAHGSTAKRYDAAFEPGPAVSPVLERESLPNSTNEGFAEAVEIQVVGMSLRDQTGTEWQLQPERSQPMHVQTTAHTLRTSPVPDESERRSVLLPPSLEVGSASPAPKAESMPPYRPGLGPSMEGFDPSEPRNSQATHHEYAPEFDGLPAPWQPLPTWFQDTQSPRVLADGMASGPTTSDGASSALTDRVLISGAVAQPQFAERHRSLAPGPPPAASAMTGSSGPAPEADIDGLAREIYGRLKEQLFHEARRLRVSR